MTQAQIDPCHREQKKGPQKIPRPALVTPPAAAEPLKGAALAAVVNRVEQIRIAETVRHLSKGPSRHSYAAGNALVASWLSEQFTALGYSTSFHEFAVGGRTLRNVEAIRAGKGPNARTVVVGAHFDSIGTNAQDPQSPAPGADDNATGIAVLLEAARLLADRSAIDELRLVAFNGEEQGLRGSKAYVHQLRLDCVDIRFMLNLDMVGFPDQQGAIRIEYDQGMTVPSNDQASRELADSMVALCRSYTTLQPALDRAYDSDYEPFEAQGWVVVGLFESGENPNYHRNTDTIDTIHLDSVAQVARLALATLLYHVAP